MQERKWVRFQNCVDYRNQFEGDAVIDANEVFGVLAKQLEPNDIRGSKKVSVTRIDLGTSEIYVPLPLDTVLWMLKITA